MQNKTLAAENFPIEVQKIFKIFLSEKPDSIRLVGGCVRDLLLQKKVADFDFATKFLPQEIIKILEKNKIKAIPTGLQHGTITAVLNGKNFEITTLRKDENCDGRHAKTKFVSDYFEDASRRDFTINALYLDFAGQIHDYFGGLEDLESQKVRFIGDAKQRINEDYLRILRFFRFSCFYAKKFDEEAIKACVEFKNNIKKLSAERIRNEFFKILLCQNEDSLLQIVDIIEQKQIREEFIFNKFNISSLKILFTLQKELKHQTQYENILRLVALIIDSVDSNSFKNLAKNLVLTNKEKKYFEFLLQNSFGNLLNKELLKELLAYENKDFVIDCFIVNLLKNYQRISDFSKVKNEFNFIKNFQLPEFPLKSSDLILLGFEGKKLGEKINLAKKLWIKGDFTLTKEQLMKAIVS